MDIDFMLMPNFDLNDMRSECFIICLPVKSKMNFIQNLLLFHN